MSINGVKYLFSAAESLKRTEKLREGLTKPFVVAVGPKTAQELEHDYHVHVSLIPSKYSSEGILESLKDKQIAGKKIRIPRTSNATPVLMENLKAKGANVEEIHVYESSLPADETLKEKFFRDLINGKIDAIVFGSGLSAKNILKMLSEKAPIEKLRAILNGKATTVAIGPTTAEALSEIGIKVDVTPEDYLFEKALVELARFWTKK